MYAIRSYYAANKDAPYNNAKEFLAYAKAHPGEVTVGNSGAGGANHVATEGLAMEANVKLKPMPFGGSAAAVTAALGGHIQEEPPDLMLLDIQLPGMDGLEVLS